MRASTTKLRQLLVAVIAVIMGVGCATTRPASAAQVLILDPTVFGVGTPSLEAQIVTNPATAAIAGLSMSVDVVAASGWATALASTTLYKAIVLGDPRCVQNSTVPLTAAMNSANANALASVVTGNVVIIGTDPTVHASQGGEQLWRSAIQFAAAGPGTGAVISLSCYYDYGGAPTPTPVAALSGFGTFMTQQAACANKVAIVASSPALTGLMNAVLSNWGCSVHEGFTSWPANFTPLALATDSTVPHIFTAGDGTTGFPYILARGVTPVAGGTVKVCKVAGLGVPVGMTFQFDVGGTMVPVPAGPPPGGYCVVVDRPFPVGTSVTVSEMIPLHHVVSSIVVEPPPPTKPNPATGSVDVVIGKGVTEVTFTDKHTGFIEICKKGHVTGSFKFSVNPGALGVVVPAGACSPAIEVAAGQVTIRELSVAPGTMVGCATIPASQLVNCSPGTLTATVNVAPGDVSAQTIVFITNRPLLPDLTTLGTQSGAHEHGQPQR